MKVPGHGLPRPDKQGTRSGRYLCVLFLALMGQDHSCFPHAARRREVAREGQMRKNAIS